MMAESGEELKLVAGCEFAEYPPRFDFYGIGERSVRTHYDKEMDKAIGRALRSVIDCRAY